MQCYFCPPALPLAPWESFLLTTVKTDHPKRHLFTSTAAQLWAGTSKLAQSRSLNACRDSPGCWSGASLPPPFGICCRSVAIPDTTPRSLPAARCSVGLSVPRGCLSTCVSLLTCWGGLGHLRRGTCITPQLRVVTAAGPFRCPCSVTA